MKFPGLVKSRYASTITEGYLRFQVVRVTSVTDADQAGVAGRRTAAAASRRAAELRRAARRRPGRVRRARGPRRRWRTSPGRPVSGSARSTGTSRPGRTCSNAVYLGEIEELCHAAEDVADLPPWEALTTWLRRFVEYAATKRAIYESLNRESETFPARPGGDVRRRHAAVRARPEGRRGPHGRELRRRAADGQRPHRGRVTSTTRSATASSRSPSTASARPARGSGQAAC